MKGWIRNYFSDFGSSQRNTVLQTIGDLCGAQLANEFKLILFQGNSALQKAWARNSPSPPRRKGVSVRGGSPLGHHHSNSHELKRMLSDPITKKIPNKRATEALLSSIASVVSFNFLETSPGLLAYELSRLESGIFRSILGREFLDKGWQQEHHSHSRNLQDMIRRFNEVQHSLAFPPNISPSQHFSLSNFVVVVVGEFLGSNGDIAARGCKEPGGCDNAFH